MRCEQPIMGFIGFQEPPLHPPRRWAPRIPANGSIPSMHSCPSEPSLPAVVDAHPSGPPSACGSSSFLSLRHAAACRRNTHPPAPLAVALLSWIRPASRAIMRLRRGDHSVTHARTPQSASFSRHAPQRPPAAHLCSAISSSRPQGTSAGSGPARALRSIRRWCAPWRPDCSLGLCCLRGRDRSPHPSVQPVHRRCPADSRPEALVPASRATHAWAASSSLGGRLQRLGGGASTHGLLPEGGVPCRTLRTPVDYNGSLRPRGGAPLGISWRRGLATSRAGESWRVGSWRR